MLLMLPPAVRHSLDLPRSLLTFPFHVPPSLLLFSIFSTHPTYFIHHPHLHAYPARPPIQAQSVLLQKPAGYSVSACFDLWYCSSCHRIGPVQFISLFNSDHFHWPILVHPPTPLTKTKDIFIRLRLTFRPSQTLCEPFPLFSVCRFWPRCRPIIST